jgi:hypothetical protein
LGAGHGHLLCESRARTVLTVELPKRAESKLKQRKINVTDGKN